MNKEDLLQDLSEHYEWTDREQIRIEEKMDEYAEQESMAFYVWAITRAFHLDAAEKLSTKELYQLYIQSKNNKP